MTSRSVPTASQNRSKPSFRKAAKRPRADRPLCLHKGSGKSPRNLLGRLRRLKSDLIPLIRAPRIVDGRNG